MKNICSRKWTRIILVSVFFIIIGCSLAGEKVAHNNGIGWDGMNYLNTIQHFTELITTHGYDQYAIQRIMPWGLVNVVFQLCHIEATPHNALIAGGVLNVLAFALAIFYFFRISSMKRWKQSTEIIAFASLFYSYALLKMPGYYILLNDTYGFLWGIVMLYLFLSNKRWWLLSMALLGAINWPGVTTICGLALVFIPKKKLDIQSTLSRMDVVVYYSLLFGIALLPLLYQLLAIITPINHSVNMFTFDGRPETSLWYFGIGVVCACAYLYYMMRPFKLSISQIWKEYNSKQLWIGVGLIMLCYVGVNYILHRFANSESGALDNTRLFKCVIESCTSDPLCFIESFFSYFGPVVLIVLLLWNQSAKYIAEKGMGYFFVIALAIFFSLRPEARVSIMFVPFMVLPVMEYIDTKNLKRWVAPVYIITSIFMSHVWFPINVEGMEAAFEEETFANLSSFPSQRFFMCSGHWQSHEMYAVWMVITIIIGGVLYMGIRRKWFVEEQ